MSQSRAAAQDRATARLIALVDDLRARAEEAEWFEFKTNNSDPKMVGKRVSALANSARLHDHDYGYMVWGVRDNDHAVVGTTFDPDATIGSQPFKLRLMQPLAPAPHLEFEVVPHPQGRLVVLRIPAADDLTVKFEGIAYVRIGSATPSLGDYPELERKLLAKLRSFVWERGPAMSYLTDEEVLDALDYDAYLRLRDLSRPTTNVGILERLHEGGMVTPDAGGRWTILNLGATLLARDLEHFPGLERKALRIIQYAGRDRLQAKPEQPWRQGYASGFEAILQFLQGILPAREVIGATRTAERGYPLKALKEILANALIHQDMTVSGTGPKVEVFEDRIAFSNPGEPVTDWRKLFGAEPRSRNESLALAMRRMRLCEERGSGLRRVIAATDAAHLLPPEFHAEDGITRVILYGHGRDFATMDQAARVRTAYHFAILLWDQGKWMTNLLLRERFGLGSDAVSKVSVLLRACVAGGWIKVADPQRPNSGYIPFWA